MTSAATSRRARRALIALFAASSLAWAPVPAALAETGETSIVTGRLVDVDGAPVDDIDVVLCGEDPSCLDPIYTTTDDDGRFMVADLAPGTAWLTVLTDPDIAGRDDLMWPDDVAVTLVGGPIELGTITVPRSPLVTGKLVDADGPVAETLVYFDNSDGAWPDSYTWTESDGTFTLRPQTSGTATLVVDSDDHRALTRSVTISPTVSLGSVRLVQIPRLVVRVTSSSGAPVPNARLVVASLDPWDLWFVNTDANGEYRTGELPLDGRYTVHLADPNWAYAEGTTAITISAAKPRAVVGLKVLRPASVSIRLATADGAPVTLPGLEVMRQVGDQWQHTQDTAEIGAGTASISGLVPGTYRLTTTADLYDQTLATVTVDEGQAIDLGLKTVRFYTETDKHSPVIGTPELVGGSRTYRLDQQESSRETLRAPIHDYSTIHARKARIELVDPQGRVAGTGWIEDGYVKAAAPIEIGTFSGYRFKVRADAHHHEATSPGSPAYTISKRPTSLSALKVSKATTTWGVGTSVTVTYTGAFEGAVQLLADGKVVEVEPLRPDYSSTSGTLIKSGTKKLSFWHRLPPGKHTLTVRYVGTPYDMAATSGSTAVTVTKAVSKAKISGKRFVKGTRPQVTVTVPRLKGGAPITGKVHLYVGKKRVRTITVKASRHAEHTVKLPVRPKSSIKVRAVYSGTKNIKGSTSRTITLKTRG